jgi:ribosome-associated translation inhibitor RaiA
MLISFHAHHAPISPTMRLRAERAIRKVARMVPRAVNAAVRFGQDGPGCRVEIELHAPRQRDLVAVGRARFPGVALAGAIAKLEAEAVRIKRTPRDRVRRAKAPPRGPTAVAAP